MLQFPQLPKHTRCAQASGPLYCLHPLQERPPLDISRTCGLCFFWPLFNSQLPASPSQATRVSRKLPRAVCSLSLLVACSLLSLVLVCLLLAGLSPASKSMVHLFLVCPQGHTSHEPPLCQGLLNLTSKPSGHLSYICLGLCTQVIPMWSSPLQFNEETEAPRDRHSPSLLPGKGRG